MSRFIHRHETRDDRGYAPSFFEEGTINELHRTLPTVVADVRGKLTHADHLKLYEAAYYAQGPILEIGRDAGRSTIVLAMGARDAGHGYPVYSIEFNPLKLRRAHENLSQFEVLDHVTLVEGDSATQVGRLPLPFDTVFVDGDHTYDGVIRDIRALIGRITAGGVLMFHDYYHPRNNGDTVGVRRAVDELAPEARLEFRGRFGAIALFEQH